MLCGCKQSEDITGEAVAEIQNIILSQDGSFSIEDCKNRGLNDKVLMLESKYCGHCKVTLPMFKEACAEKGVNPIILDVSEPEQRKQMESHGISIRFTPTFVFGCDYYMGSKQKQEYLQLLDKFLND